MKAVMKDKLFFSLLMLFPSSELIWFIKIQKGLISLGDFILKGCDQVYTFMTSLCALTWAVVGKRICQNRNHRLGVAAMFTSVRTEPRVEPLDAASLRQQRRLKQALQFLHRDSADLLPLDGLKKLGTAKQGVCCRPGGDTLTFIQTD